MIMLDIINHPGGVRCLPYHITQLAVPFEIFLTLEKEQHSRAENAVLEMFACLKYNKGCDSRNCAVCHKHQNCSHVHKCPKQKVHTVLYRETITAALAKKRILVIRLRL